MRFLRSGTTSLNECNCKDSLTNVVMIDISEVAVMADVMMIVVMELP